MGLEDGIYKCFTAIYSLLSIQFKRKMILYIETKNDIKIYIKQKSYFVRTLEKNIELAEYADSSDTTR